MMIFLYFNDSSHIPKALTFKFETPCVCVHIYTHIHIYIYILYIYIYIYIYIYVHRMFILVWTFIKYSYWFNPIDLKKDMHM